MSDIIKNLLSGDDFYLSHQCGGYYERLAMQSACIKWDETPVVSGFVEYSSHSQLYWQNKWEYRNYHCHTTDNTMYIARSADLSGHGTFGGWFGLPNLDIFKNWQCRDQQFSTHNGYKKYGGDIADLPKSCKNVGTKVLVSFDDVSIIAAVRFFTSHTSTRVFTIRPMLSAIPKEDGLDFVTIEITDTAAHLTILHAKPHPKKYSNLWFSEKIKQVITNTKWDVEHKTIRLGDFNYELFTRQDD